MPEFHSMYDLSNHALYPESDLLMPSGILTIYITDSTGNGLARAPNDCLLSSDVGTDPYMDANFRGNDGFNETQIMPSGLSHPRNPAPVTAYISSLLR